MTNKYEHLHLVIDKTTRNKWRDFIAKREADNPGMTYPEVQLIRDAVESFILLNRH